MASLSGQTLAKEGVPYYIPVGSYDPSGFPIINSPLIVGGNPYDAYLNADSNIRLTAVSNGTPLASMSMTSNIAFAVPGMTCNSLTMSSGLTTVGSTLRIDSLGGPGYLQMVDTPTGALISNIGTPAGSFIAFNNNGNINLNGLLFANPTSFFTLDGGGSSLQGTTTALNLTTGSGTVVVGSFNRTGADINLSSTGNLNITSSNFQADTNFFSYTATNGFGMELNPGFGGTTNVFSFKLPGGNTTNNIQTTSNSMTTTVGGTGLYTLNASSETLVWTTPSVYQARTPSQSAYYNGSQVFQMGINLPSNRFEGYWSTGASNGLWMTVSSNGNVDFPQGFSTNSLTTPSNSSNSIGGVVLQNGNIQANGAGSNSFAGLTISSGALTNSAPTSNSVGGVVLSNSFINAPGTTGGFQVIGNMFLSNGYEIGSTQVGTVPNAPYLTMSAHLQPAVQDTTPFSLTSNITGYSNIVIPNVSNAGMIRIDIEIQMTNAYGADFNSPQWVNLQCGDPVNLARGSIQTINLSQLRYFGATDQNKTVYASLYWVRNLDWIGESVQITPTSNSVVAGGNTVAVYNVDVSLIF